MENYNFYRKYRPNQFIDVVGQDNIVKILTNAINTNRLSHAYLFNGPRGTGKTSIAKIFSKEINGITQEGEHPDIWEMDAASNNGVEEIRKIIENVNFLPIDAKYKVYIIDEVHMLSKGAFNALLKTLEEPPEHVIFILATTEIHKIPVTIISRCQRYDFKRITEKDIIERMADILNKEKIKFEDLALEKIAQLADGAMRDALSLLEKVVVFDENVTYENVCISFELVTNSILEEFINLLMNGSSKQVIEYYEKLYYNGIDEKKFIVDLQYYLKEQILKNSSRKMISILSELNKLEEKLYFSNNIKLVIEVFLINIAKENNSMEEIITMPIQENKKETVVIKSSIPVAITEKKNIEETENIILEDEQTANIGIKDEISNDIDKGHNIILLDVLSGTTHEQKVNLKEAFNKIHDLLVGHKKFGIAKFFETADINGASDDGCLITLEKEYHDVFQERLDEIKEIIEHHNKNNYEVFLMTKEEWKQERPKYVEKVKNYRKEDSYSKATQVFSGFKINRK